MMIFKIIITHINSLSITGDNNIHDSTQPRLKGKFEKSLLLSTKILSNDV